MDNTLKKIISIKNYKHTKIIATIGPSTNSYSAIESLISAGANGLRLNFSHGDFDERKQQIKWIREASASLKKPVAIIQDLQGPKIRLGDFMGVISISKGQELRFAYNSDYSATGIIPTQYDLSKKVKRGEKLYLSDGRIICTITSVIKDVVYAKAHNEGALIRRKGLNLPDTDFGGDVITAKDKRDIVFGSTQDIDYVAISFVQSDIEINTLRKILSNLGSRSKIIAKIETKSAVDNLNDIFMASDAVMVARGDLAIEVPFESVPIIQRKIIGLGLEHNKPTIVATQMLYSMTDSPEPTRAEVADIATAVLVGSDAVMLSDETASGDYPLEAVRVMKKIILYTEKNTPLNILGKGDVIVTASGKYPGIVGTTDTIKVRMIE